MNIININLEKIREHINQYILYNNPDIRLSIDTVVTYDKPIILMNNDTLNLLKRENKYYIINDNINNNNVVPMIFGCYIAIANWLPLGEVELK